MSCQYDLATRAAAPSREDAAPDRFLEPATIEEATARRNELVKAIESIQSQLANCNRMVDGRRMSAHEWDEWKSRAVSARAFRVSELRKVKAWMAAYQQKIQSGKGLLPEAKRAVFALADHVRHLEAGVVELLAAADAFREVAGDAFNLLDGAACPIDDSAEWLRDVKRRLLDADAALLKAIAKVKGATP